MKYFLNNKMPVILIQDPKSPVVSIKLWVKTGSCDEKPEEAGVSHFIEHLVFKGTKSFDVGEVATQLEGAGGQLNAYTSFDQTVYYVTLSKEYYQLGLKAISEMVSSPRFDGAEIDKEREVVIEEIKRGRDSLSQQASRLLFESNFKVHPYGRPVIGYEEIIQKITKDEIIDYFKRRYTSENMFLVVCGGFDESEIKSEISGFFNEIPSFSLVKSDRPKEPNQTEQAIVIKKTEFKEAKAYLSWKACNALDEDVYALDMFAYILGQSQSSRLFKSLRLENPLCNSISASAFTPKDLGLFAISVSFDQKNFDQLFAKIFEELSLFLESGPKEEELNKAVKSFVETEAYSTETVDGVANKVGYYEDLLGDFEFHEKYLEKITRLTSKDIIKVARKYLIKDNFTFSSLLQEPEGLEEKILKLSDEFHQFDQLKNQQKEQKSFGVSEALLTKFSKKLVDENEKKFKQTLETISHKGIKISFLKNDSPVCAVQGAVHGGLWAEDKLGEANLFAKLWACENSSYSENQMINQLEDISASLSGFGGRNSVGLSMKALSMYKDESIELFLETLFLPKFSEEIFIREKNILLNQVKIVNDEASYLASKQFYKNIFSGQIYENMPLGTHESLSGMTLKDMEKYFKKIANFKNLHLVVAGNIAQKDFLNRLDKYLDLSQKTDQRNTWNASEVKIYKSQEFSPETTELEKIKIDKNQTHIILGFKSFKLDDPRIMTLEVLEAMLSGQGGRLFLNLRDEQSLAYSVSPIRFHGVNDGYFAVYIACSPEKQTQAIESIYVEIKKLVDREIEDVELIRAKKYLIGRHDIGLQKNSSLASSILFDQLYGIPAGSTFSYKDEIKKVSLDSVYLLVDELFKSKPSYISVAGPE